MPAATCYRPHITKVVSWSKRTLKEVSETPSVRELCNGESPAYNQADISIIFANADEIRECSHCSEKFSDKFQIPKSWWTHATRNSNGYFGYRDLLNDKGQRDGTISWVRFMAKLVTLETEKGITKIKYNWIKLNAFSKWDAVTNRTDIILFDHPDFAEIVVESLLDHLDENLLHDPFWIYPPMAENVVELQEDAVWKTRDLVRSYEVYGAISQLDFPGLDDIPRHLIHVHEMVNVGEITLESIKSHHEHFLGTQNLNAQPQILNSATNTTSKMTPSTPDLLLLNIQNRLSSSLHMLSSLRHRSDSNKARIQEGISLAYNLTARRDSAAMRTISVVGLVFLPATFVAAIFSTTFFSFDPSSDSWTRSSKFWVYWAFTVPITLLTIILWYFGPKIWARVPARWKSWLH